MTTHQDDDASLAIPQADAACFERRASHLLLAFTKGETGEGTSVRDWSPDRPVDGHLDKSNILGPVIIERIDESAMNVESLSVSFSASDYNLDRVGCRLLDQLSEDWALHPKLNGLSTTAAMRDRLKRWCFSVLETGQFHASVDSILADLKSALCLHEVWVQLSDIEVQDSFPLGMVEIRGVGVNQIAQWVKEMHESKFSAASLDLTQADLIREWQGHTAAIYRGYGDRDAAKVAAVEHAELACAILRVLDPKIRLPSYRSYLQPITLNSQSNERALLVDPGMRESISQSYVLLNPPCGPSVTRENLPTFWEGALWRRAHQLLSMNPPTMFQKHLIGAILIHARLSLTSDPIEKLIFAITSLETMLYGGDKTARQGTIKKRLASILARTDSFREHVFSVVGKAYRLRSNFMHHGQRIKETQVIEEFLTLAWLFFRRMIADHDRWETVNAYCNELDSRFHERFAASV